jgi:hypothetical protein
VGVSHSPMMVSGTILPRLTAVLENLFVLYIGRKQNLLYLRI